VAQDAEGERGGDEGIVFFHEIAFVGETAVVVLVRKDHRELRHGAGDGGRGIEAEAVCRAEEDPFNVTR
jgi:hypothetical protein